MKNKTNERKEKKEEEKKNRKGKEITGTGHSSSRSTNQRPERSSLHRTSGRRRLNRHHRRRRGGTSSHMMNTLKRRVTAAIFPPCGGARYAEAGSFITQLVKSASRRSKSLSAVCVRRQPLPRSPVYRSSCVNTVSLPFWSGGRSTAVRR